MTQLQYNEKVVWQDVWPSYSIMKTWFDKEVNNNKYFSSTITLVSIVNRDKQQHFNKKTL